MRRALKTKPNTKRVCEFLSIPRDYLEHFAVLAVKETLSDSYVIGRIEEHVKNLLGTEPPVRDMERDATMKDLEVIDRKIYNLLQIIEDGHQGGESVKKRLAELEEKKEELQHRLKMSNAGDDSTKIADTAIMVRKFVGGFESEFSQVSQEERKVMIQKCIADIVIDREKSVARFQVYRIPVLTPEIEKALKSSENEGTVMSCRSARNRVHN